MTTIDVADAGTSAAGDSRLAWTCPEPVLWTASEPTPHGAVYAGFVQQVGERFVAVDGLGAALGAFDELELAQRAVAAAVATTLAASIWMRQA